MWYTLRYHRLLRPSSGLVEPAAWAEEVTRPAMVRLEDYLTVMEQRGASDLFLKAGSPPFLRIDGRLVPHAGPPLTPDDLRALARGLMSEDQAREFAQRLELDLAVSVPRVGRFRANILTQRGTVAIVIRHIQLTVRSFEDLHLPATVLQKLAREHRGLVLVTGRTGSGKSTTIASILDEINTHLEKHIITLEDPIEFLHTDKCSMVTQRELPFDTRSYHAALKHVMRQSPDVIFIGDILDIETMECALMAAESGHLVLSELHTTNAPQTIERVLSFFPPHQHPEIRLRLSLLLKGVLSLRLLARKEGGGRVPACEVLVTTPTLRDLIREGQIQDLHEYMRDGALFGMQTFNQAVAQLFHDGLVTEDEARMSADGLEELELELREIRSGRLGNRRAAWS